MELRHLRYFLAVCDALHFGRAARASHVSQPTLSQQIKQLEDELGAQLFERGRAGVRLTEAGVVFRGHASRAIEDVRAGELAVGAVSRLEAGVLRVGYPPSLRGLAAPALCDVLQGHPGLSVTAEETLVPRLERRLAEGKLDAALGYAPKRADELSSEPLFASRLRLVVAESHPFASRPMVAARELIDQPFALLSKGLRARARADAYLAHVRLSPRVILSSNAVATVLAAVRSGLALTLLPEPRLEPAEGLRVVSLSPAPPAEEAALLFRRDAPLSASAAAFADRVRARI